MNIHDRYEEARWERVTSISEIGLFQLALQENLISEDEVENSVYDLADVQNLIYDSSISDTQLEELT